ncbi:hypothetical protein H4J46_14985 [Colwellia sp. MB02u-6]|jgi:putative transposase|nr:hypothetical protein [Colwellia sp. MB02u-6]
MSFVGGLKQERIQWKNDQTHFEAQQDILNDIVNYMVMFYNRCRLDFYLGYKSLNHNESEMMKLKKFA